MSLVRRLRPAALVLAFAFALGCASTQVTQHDSRIEGIRIPRPDRILVFDFGAAPADVAGDSALAGHYDPAQAPSQEDLEQGRELGAMVAARLVENIQDLGLPAQRASKSTPLQVNDIVIRGYFVTLDQGSRSERMLIGFGAGAAKLSTVVEGYQMTAQGLRRLGRATVESGGGKGPGAALPAAIAIATANPIGLVVTSAAKIEGEASGRTTLEGRAKSTADKIAGQLEQRFREQGWIQ